MSDRENREKLIREGENFSPVVGWLVMIEGNQVGKSFPLVEGLNSIGRGADNRVPVGDLSILEGECATIMFDSVSGDFVFTPSTTSTSVYHNELPLEVPVKLKERDLIKIGENTFVLIKFCNEEYRWVEERA